MPYNNLQDAFEQEKTMHDEQSISKEDGGMQENAATQHPETTPPESAPEIPHSSEPVSPVPVDHAESPVASISAESSTRSHVAAERSESGALTQSDNAPAEVAVMPAPKQQQLSKRAKLSPEFIARWKELQDAQRERKELDMRVVRKIKGGTILDFKGLDVFMPFSHWHAGPEFSDIEIDKALGHTLPVRVIEVSAPEKGRAVASRRKMLMEARCASFTEGQVIKGHVSGITSFGIFVDLGGVEGLVHISQLAPYKIHNPGEALKVGAELTVSIYKIDQKRGRVWLNMQESPGGPWKDAAAKYSVGSVHKGKVTLLKKYGIFVELEPTVEAFVHVQELSWTRRVKDPADNFKSGDQVDVKVLKFKESAHKIEASVKQARENPWSQFSTTYRKGAACQGKVKEVVDKGAVIELPDDVDGFLPRSKMMPRGSDTPPELHVGDMLNLRVVDFSTEQQFIILGIKYDSPDAGSRGPSGPRERRERRDDRSRGEMPIQSGARPTIGELISDTIRKKLQGTK